MDPATRQGERRLMAQMLLKYGVAFVSGSPPTHEGTMNAANAFSVIQERDNIERNKKLWDLARLNRDKYGQLSAVQNMAKFAVCFANLRIFFAKSKLQRFFESCHSFLQTCGETYYNIIFFS